MLRSPVAFIVGRRVMLSTSARIRSTGSINAERRVISRRSAGRVISGEGGCRVSMMVLTVGVADVTVVRGCCASLGVRDRREMRLENLCPMMEVFSWFWTELLLDLFLRLRRSPSIAMRRSLTLCYSPKVVVV